MEELRIRLEALAQKIALKEAEILDLRSEVHALKALLNAAIDEQIRLEEIAAQQEEQAKVDRAAALVQEALNQQRLKQAQENDEQAEANIKAAKLAKAQAAKAEADRIEAEKKELEAKAQEAIKESETEVTEVIEVPAEETTEHHHEAIMRTIEQMSRSISGLDKKTNAEKFTEKPNLSDRVSKLRLNDLKKAIGLNEKFLYVNELFGGDMNAFKQAVDELNHLDTQNDANRLLNEDLADKYHWKAEDETVIAFKSLVSRRFA